HDVKVMGAGEVAARVDLLLEEQHVERADYGAAGHGREHLHVAQDVELRHPPQYPEMEQRRAEPAPGKRQAELLGPNCPTRRCRHETLSYAALAGRLLASALEFALTASCSAKSRSTRSSRGPTSMCPSTEISAAVPLELEPRLLRVDRDLETGREHLCTPVSLYDRSPTP